MSNASDVGSNTSLLTQNTIDIGNNATDLAATQTAVTTNASDIYANQQNIAANTSAIASLSGTSASNHYHDIPAHSHQQGTHTHGYWNTTTNSVATSTADGGFVVTDPLGQTSGPAGSTATGHTHEAGHYHSLPSLASQQASGTHYVATTTAQSAAHSAANPQYNMQTN